MKRSPFPGSCIFCQKELPKVAVAKHLSTCSRRPRGDRKAFHLIVESPRTPYWLHLEGDANATLRDLDHLLRAHWLECCGHLSAFTIGNLCFTSGAPQGFEDRDMDVALDKVLTPGLTCVYQYDFGSTTELQLRVIAALTTGHKGKPPILLLAQNSPPEVACSNCGQPSRLICTDCVYSGKGALCNKCGKEHKCGEEMLLALVNSPRAGVCAYAG